MAACRLAQGCLPSTGQGIPQCRWGNVTAAQKYCSEWPDCLGFHCSVEFRTDPGGCGDCPQPAGSWCKCTKVESCQARGNGTKLTGGGSGDQQDYAYIKAGNATGWMQLPSSQPAAARRLWLAVAAAARASVGCQLKPGAPSAYKQLCEAQLTRAACTQLNETCVWHTAPRELRDNQSCGATSCPFLKANAQLMTEKQQIAARFGRQS